MLTTLLLALATAPARADTLEVSVEFEGTTASWTVEDAQQGRVLSETLDMTGRRHVEVTLDYEVLDEGKLRFTAEVVEVRKGLLGREKRNLVARPRITTKDGTPAVITQGSRSPIPGTDPVEFEEVVYMMLRVLPTVSG